MEVSPESGIVDGHGPDATHPPGPELERLTNALRRVVNQSVHTNASPDELGRAALAIEAVADQLASLTPEWAPSVKAFVEGLGPEQFFPFSPQIGPYNALAPPIHVEVVDGVVRGSGVLGPAYEGPPGCVHGGMVASLFDEILGVANIAAGVGAMTGTLTIKYRSPTPLMTELTFTARQLGVDGRKVRTEGSIHAGDRLCAEADGIFILVDHSRFLQHTQVHGSAERES
jgi:acyl-coenzyme A thioesterase PaaI-like protein